MFFKNILSVENIIIIRFENNQFVFYISGKKENLKRGIYFNSVGIRSRCKYLGLRILVNLEIGNMNIINSI